MNSCAIKFQSLTRKIAVVAACLGAVGLASQPALAGDLNFGKPGEPVQLVVGYQPYYTQSWSGIAMRGKEFWKKYLPAGSTVEFQVGLQGAIIVNAMLAGKQHIGYMGDMPAIVSTTKQDVADIRIVATVGFGTDQCDIFLVKKDAPEFKSPKEGMAWLSGKQVAVPKGSCADRFAQAVFKKENIQPAEYLNQNIEVITSGFRAGKIDAAVIWEPTASRLLLDGLARRVASGANVGEHDAAFLGMRSELIKQRPDIVKGWLNAELDAELFVSDPKNSLEVARMAVEQSTGFTEKSMWMAMYGRYPDGQGGAPVRNEFIYTMTPASMELIAKATTFLFSIKSINVEKLRPEAVMPEFADAVLKERGLKSPVGQVNAQPLSDYKGKP